MEFNKKEIARIAFHSFMQAWNWSVWKWLFFGGIGALSGTLKFGENFFELNTKKSALYAGIIVVSLYVLRFLLIFGKESLKYFHEVYQNSSYGDAIVILKDCFAEVHYYRKSDGFQEDEFVKAMMLFCNNLKVIFDKLTKSNCSVSIKVPVREENVTPLTVLKNLTRDTNHSTRDTKTYMETEYTINGNTAFNNTLNKVITNDSKKYYINNFIASTDNYLSTSKKCYPNGQLPYKSELVHSISPIKSLAKNNYDCYGFLCIDSDKENVFINNYYPELVEGVCDGIADIILELNKNKNDNKTKATN